MIQRYIHIHLKLQKNCRLFITNKRKNTLNSHQQEEEVAQEDR